MVIKDKFTSWFLKNIVKPRRQEIDKPGFITIKISDENTRRRDIFIPEDLLADIEDKIEEEFGDKGKSELYKSGKQFGWRYAQIGDFPTKNEVNDEKITRFVDFFVKFIEILYASRIEYELDIEEETFGMEMEEYTVCRHNGKGYLLTTGAVAGVVSYVFSNEDIEAVQPRCQGRGDTMCDVTCADISQLPEDSMTAPVRDDLGLESKYKTVNEVRKTEYAENSLQDLLNRSFFEYEQGILSYEGERYARVEASIIYFIDMLASEVEADTEIIFDAAFEHGKKIGAETEDIGFISDFLPALGWGDVRPIDEGTINIYAYPWTRFAEESDFTLFRGLVSGIMSGITGETIVFEKDRTSLSQDGFNVVLEAS